MQSSGAGVASEIIDVTDAAVVTELHEAHGAALYDFARHLGLSDEQAADALQEAILRLWREMRRGTLIERPPAWLTAPSIAWPCSSIDGGASSRCSSRGSPHVEATTPGRRHPTP